MKAILIILTCTVALTLSAQDTLLKREALHMIIHATPEQKMQVVPTAKTPKEASKVLLLKLGTATNNAPLMDITNKLGKAGVKLK